MSKKSKICTVFVASKLYIFITDELKEFLSIVQHDRKFFLIETAHVFKRSVLNLDQFSAYKALMGFEAISQYANNLFRKPWRKEYRCIKVSSILPCGERI